MALFEPLFQELNESGGRYVVVGGVAVVLHGYPRLTADLDLVVDLDPVEARKTISALTNIGFAPRVPVDPMTFADGIVRRRWVEEMGMKVFNLYDPKDPLRSVDLFAEEPIPFEELWSRAMIVNLRTVSVRVASIPHLVQMKSHAGRPQDVQDIEALRAIESRRERVE